MKADRQRPKSTRPGREEHFRSLFENMLEGYAYCRMLYADGAPQDFVYLEVNRAFEKLTGLKQVAGKKISEVIPGVQRTNPELFQIYGRVALSGRSEKFETFVEPLGIWFSISVYSPRKEHFVAVFDNITERKRMEDRLRKSEELLREAIRVTGLGIFEHDHQTDLIYWSPEQRRHYGWPADQPVTLPDVIHSAHPEDRERIAVSVRAAHDPARDGRYDVEHRIVRRDGTIRWLLVRSQTLFEGEGATRHPRLTVGAQLDITERKQADDALRLHSAALTAAANAIVITDRAGAIVWVNPAFSALTGYTLAEAVGKNPRDLVKSGRQERAVYEEMWATILAGRIWHGQLENRRKDGSFYPEEQTITPLRDAAGEITHFIAIKLDLSERKQAEESLRREQALLNSLVSTIPDRIYFKDRQSRFVLVNEAMARHFGLRDPAEAIGKTDFEFFTEEHARQAGEDEQRVIKTGEAIVGFEEKETWPDGQTTWVSTTKVPLRDPEGRITGLVGISRDITERKRAEAGLRLFRALVDQSTDIIEVVDPESGRLLDVNKKGCLDLGYSREEYLALSVFDLDPTVSPSGYPKIVEGLRQAGVLMWQGSHRRKDGSTFPVEVSIKYVRLDRDYSVAIVRDITERKQVEDALRQSEVRYRLLFDDNPLPIWVYDVESLRFLAVNESAVQHYGHAREEFLGMTITQLYPPEDVPALLEVLAQRQTADTRSGEFRHRRKDGKIIQVEILSRPLAFGGRDARLVLATDVTEKKLLEKKFLRAQRLEAIGTLASGVAHDLNNILAPMLMIGGLLKPKLTAARDREILAMVETGAQRGASIIGQLLTFSRGVEGARISVQLRHLLKDMEHLMRETFPRSIEIGQNIPSELWTVLADATQMHQVIMNLCVNARDAMPGGGKLMLSAENLRLDEALAQIHPDAKPGPHVMLTVTDTGTGIPPEIILRIFDPFFTTKGPDKGTGLGLSTVTGIVKSHGGFVTVYSEPGRGTTFKVYLPATGGTADLREAGSTSPIPMGNEELILVVDDETPIVVATRDVLIKYRYRVLSAGNGIDALKLFIQHSDSVGLVLTDVMMPGMGWKELVRSLRIIKPDIKIIATSGMEQEDKRSEFTDLGITEILSKPCAPALLLKAVTQALATKPSSQGVD